MKKQYLLLFLSILFFSSCVNLKLDEGRIVGKWIPDAKRYRKDIFETSSRHPCGAFSFFHVENPDTFIFYEDHRFLYKRSEENKPIPLYELSLGNSENSVVFVPTGYDSIVGEWMGQRNGFQYADGSYRINFKLLKCGKKRMTAIAREGLFFLRLRFKRVE